MSIFEYFYTKRRLRKRLHEARQAVAAVEAERDEARRWAKHFQHVSKDTQDRLEDAVRQVDILERGWRFGPANFDEPKHDGNPGRTAKVIRQGEIHTSPSGRYWWETE
jgi:hypothetical protein